MRRGLLAAAITSIACLAVGLLAPIPSQAATPTVDDVLAQLRHAAAVSDKAALSGVTRTWSSNAGVAGVLRYAPGQSLTSTLAGSGGVEVQAAVTLRHTYRRTLAPSTGALLRRLGLPSAAWGDAPRAISSRQLRLAFQAAARTDFSWLGGPAGTTYWRVATATVTSDAAGTTISLAGSDPREVRPFWLSARLDLLGRIVTLTQRVDEAPPSRYWTRTVTSIRYGAPSAFAATSSIPMAWRRGAELLTVGRTATWVALRDIATEARDLYAHAALPSLSDVARAAEQNEPTAGGRWRVTMSGRTARLTVPVLIGRRVLLAGGTITYPRTGDPVVRLLPAP